MNISVLIEPIHHETTHGYVAGYSPKFKGQGRPSSEVEHILMYPPCGILKSKEQAQLAYALLSDKPKIFAEPEEGKSSGNGRRDIDLLRKEGYQIDSEYHFLEPINQDALFYIPTTRGRQQLIANLELFLFREEQNKQISLNLFEE